MTIPSLTTSLLACAMCTSGASETTVMAANGAIFLMLGVLGTMLASIAGFMVYLARRARRYSFEAPKADK